MDGGNHIDETSNMSESNETELAFRMADKENSGYLTKSEFAEMAKKLSLEQIDKIFAIYDKDGDGKIDYEEFCQLMSLRRTVRN